MRCWGLVLGGLLFVAPALAASPDGSVRPQARPNAEPVEIAAAMRPQARPVSEQVVAASTRSAPFAPPLGRSPRPFLRPPEILERVMSRRREARRGMVCGDPQIQGDVIGVVPGRLSACGIDEAVRIKSVSGVSLSQQSLMDCTTAKALTQWVNNGVKPALRSKGGVAELRVAAHYACRTRNNQPGARISEHGKGKAIDISGFTMNDGEVITVLSHWNKRGYRTAMRKMHRTACGPFGTVLGPESDRFHRDHFHFDTARYRSGPYCR